MHTGTALLIKKYMQEMQIPDVVCTCPAYQVSPENRSKHSTSTTINNIK